MSQIIVALDTSTPQVALDLAKELDPALCFLKVGKELFYAGGHDVVEKLREMEFEIFLDLKDKDIPNTIRGAVRAVLDMGVFMMTIDCMAGRQSLEAAAEMCSECIHQPLLIGATVLTHMTVKDLYEIGLRGDPCLYVHMYAELAKNCGLDGVTCSGQELTGLRRKFGSEFRLITPGIRRESDLKNEQERTCTIEEAARDGGDYFVVGRPITHSSDPARELRDFHRRLFDYQHQAA